MFFLIGLLFASILSGWVLLTVKPGVLIGSTDVFLPSG